MRTDGQTDAWNVTYMHIVCCIHGWFIHNE